MIPVTAPTTPHAPAELRGTWSGALTRSLSGAEELLDWLECMRVEVRELLVLRDDLFCVRWVQPHSVCNLSPGPGGASLVAGGM